MVLCLAEIRGNSGFVAGLAGLCKVKLAQIFLCKVIGQIFYTNPPEIPINPDFSHMEGLCIKKSG